MKTGIAVLIILLFFLLQCNAVSPNDITTHYQIKLELDPVSQYMYVKMNLRLNPVEPLPDTLNFSLHKQFKLIKVIGGGIHDFVFDKDAPPASVFMREARPLTIILNKETDRNKPLNILFEYEGNLTEWPENSANVITEDWVELGMYLPWFPSGFICGYFTFEIEAECDPAYQLRSYGSYTKTNDTWHLKGIIPTFDIILVASKRLKTTERQSGGNRVIFHYQSLQDSTAERLSEDLAGVLELYEEWFGGDKKGETLTVIQSPREKGGDYARRGLITLSRLTDEKYVNQHEHFIRNLGHETAHFWWHMAPTNSWEDWLNEGFAEYSALLVIREMFGDKAFKKWIEDKETAIKDTPPIWGFDRNNMEAMGGPDIIEANLYSKGPVLLQLLSERIGDNEFKGLCKDIVESSTSSTIDFLTLLEKNHGSESKEWFEDLLKSY